MIKQYIEFIKESNFSSLGEWIESLMGDEYIRNIVSRYTKESDPSVDISNAINILDHKTKREIVYQVKKYLQDGIQQKDPEVIASVDTEEIMESEISVYGKGVFSSFLKTLTALGQKEMSPSWEKCPDNFLIYYYFQDLQADVVKQVFLRFKSLGKYADYFDYSKNEVSLYFGIKCDGNFEYGLCYDVATPIGQFRLSNSSIKWICQIESKSAASLKKEIVNLSFPDIITLGRIKLDMMTYNPGYYEQKMKPVITDRVISFAYYGIGKWDNGKLDEGEFLNIKNNFNNWLLSKKWSSKILISVKSSGFWVYLHIKLK